MPTDVTTTILGHTRLAVGASADVLEWPEGRALKLFRAGFPREAIELELLHSRLAHAAGVPTPRAQGLASLGGRTGIVFERCDGPTLYELIARQAQPAARLAEQFFAVQRAIHACRAPALEPLAAKLSHRIAHARGVPEPARQSALAMLAAAPESDILCHGDFHPVNVIMAEAGAVAIDWLDAARGDPAMDVTLTLVYLRHARPRALDAGYRAAFVEAYIGQCRQAWEGRLDELTRWQLPVALARLAQAVEPAERSALLTLVDALS